MSYPPCPRYTGTRKKCSQCWGFAECCFSREAIPTTERSTDAPTPEAVDLLPCPCCGSRVIFGEVADPNNENFGGIFIECTSCIITTDLRFSSKEDARPLLAEQWNSRPAIDAFAKAAVEKERERCHGIAKSTYSAYGTISKTAEFIAERIESGEKP